jgi:Ca-activated chloride channel family protein
MSFIWPAMLLFLLAIPLVFVLYLKLQQRRRQIAAQFSSFGLVQGSSGQRIGIRRHIPTGLFLAGLSILVIAMARPQAMISMPRIEGTVILAFDVSGSMAADDMQPTRMEAAKAAAKDFIERQPSSVKIGVVAFSDSGFSVRAPTDDQVEIMAAINRLAPERGTSLGRGILASLDAIAPGLGQVSSGQSSELEGPVTPTPLPEGTYTSAVVVLLTDGENTTTPDPLAAAQVAADRGVRIYTIGIGSPEGAILDIDGFNVHTMLNEATLQQISQLTGGAYYNAENEEDLHKIYGDLSPQWVIKPEKTEVTSVLAGASILVLLLGGMFSLLWFSRMP